MISRKLWPNGQVASFRVYPRDQEGYDDYFQVRVFKTARQMRLYANEGRRAGRKIGMDCCGLCAPVTGKFLRRGRFKVDLKCGEVLLEMKHLGVNVVSHEFTHAALAYARHKKIPVTDGAKGEAFIGWEEEIVCHAVGDMTGRCYKNLYKAGVIE